MKHIIGVFAAFILAVLPAGAVEWKAEWITHEHCRSGVNAWVAFRTVEKLDAVPESVTARIAVDSRYWLWINGEPVVREGGLKRGPERGGGYYDTVEIAPYLRAGDNCIAVLVWHFGQNGFSHENSGVVSLLFQAEGDGVEILSGRPNWQSAVHKGFSTVTPVTNFRLPESSIRFDAGAFEEDWIYGKGKFGDVIELGIKPGEVPMGVLVERPIPMWKDCGVTDYTSVSRNGNDWVCGLPYNAQVHPCLKVKAPAGKVISIFTDHKVVTGEQCVCAEYVTRDGEQSFECFDWMNGETVTYSIPDGVQVVELRYRETAYDTEISGWFRCDDQFLNDYWKKAARTLRVCMRDTYYDCPDRERAQWWGDEVNELEQAFQMLSPSSALLARKGIMELVSWQKSSGVMFSPVPCGNWYRELPMQILASVGWYGIHSWWMGTGDDSIIPEVYPAVHKYLHEVWKTDSDGLPIYRTGEWDWPDAGDNCDKDALLGPWYYLALKAEADFARRLGKAADAAADEAMMARLAESYDKRFWKGNRYRSDEYKGADDDRVQAMAIVSGIASKDKYPALVSVIDREYHATTYMERYVLDALFIAGQPDKALARMRKVYPTVMKDSCSTLWEHWDYTGTCNHAWTGGGAIELGSRVAGITPVEAGYKVFRVQPQMGSLKRVEAGFDTVSGRIELILTRSGKTVNAVITVPEGTKALARPSKAKSDQVLGPGVHKVRF